MLQARHPAAPAAGRRGRHRRRRRCAGDLFVPRRDGRQHPRVSGPVRGRNGAGVGHHARGQLPLDAGRARRGQRADGRRRAAVPQGPADDAGAGHRAALRHGRGRPGAGRTTSSHRVLEARESGVPLKRQAVLFRSSHHSDVLELELTRRNIPFVKYGGLKFLEAAHVKDLLAVLRWADNPKNRIAAFRVLQLLPGMGPADAQSSLVARFERGRLLRGHAFGSLHARPRRAARRSVGSVRRADGRPRRAPKGPWQGQVARTREWFEPHLERIYESAQVRLGDLDSARAAGAAVRDARSVSCRAGARSAAGHRRSRRARRISTRTTWCCRPSTRRKARSGTPCTS